MAPGESNESERPARKPGDGVFIGVLIAVGCQVFAIVFTLAIPRFFPYWGAVQWLALVPVYLWQKHQGYRLAANGLLITGFVGTLLNTGCDALIMGLWRLH
ncbi:MAG TPA: hypothetical protein VNY05_38310 [Candidatus Acidoferrales bacterium]|jgi:hypothetical protein|nr:hypothetical protein [Candidatus Acidoferrales bacterium]